ncbi:MAG: efflux RND transporter periplasmic adaptor subunit [Pseudomonadota bacterium]
MKSIFAFAVLAAAAFSAPSTVVAQDQGPRVIVEVAHETEFVDRIEAIGTLRAAESVEISANVTETITKIGFDDGQSVSRGQILVELEHDEETALVAEARAAVEIATREFDRAAALLDRATLSESVMQSRQRDLSFAEAQLARALAQEADRIVRAPFDGVVGLRTVSLGTTVRPGDPIVRIDDVSELNLDFAVPATRLATLAKGQSVTAVSPALPGEVFTGEIQTIDTVVDTTTRSVLVRAVIPNADGRLKPGLLMTVAVEAAPRTSVTIDEAALIPAGRQMTVYVVVDAETGARVEQREVDIGARQTGSIEILAGLAPGDRVITHGTLKVRPGSPVTPVETDRANGTPLSQFLDKS